jgi:hypothetical protein
MKASSESGLWALTISRDATDVIDGRELIQCTTAHRKSRTDGEEKTKKQRKSVEKMEKGGHPIGS